MKGIMDNAISPGVFETGASRYYSQEECGRRADFFAAGNPKQLITSKGIRLK